MVLTREENDLFTQIGPGTPMGNLLRRYWHPVAAAVELDENQPTKFVRILGENFVLFLDKSGKVGLIQDHCPHRGASMLYGRVEERGIACAYHGWLYDTQGNCLETPAEPADSKLYLTVKATAYPVQKFLGMYWAYLGPQPAPIIPRYDVWVREDLKRSLTVGPNLDCNWFQAFENAVDPYHSAILHQDAYQVPVLSNTTRGAIDEIEHIEGFQTPFGIMKRHYYHSGAQRQHPMIFPNILALARDTQFTVPIDDTHTARFRLYHVPRREGDPEQLGDLDQLGNDDLPTEISVPYKSPADAMHPFTRFRMRDEVLAQDFMAWETQGPIANRTVERLATSDTWIVQMRELFKENMAKVERGEDPLGLIRDPAHQAISTDMWSTAPEGPVEAAGRSRRGEA